MVEARAAFVGVRGVVRDGAQAQRWVPPVGCCDRERQSRGARRVYAGMGQSRKVVPGTTYLITRRCADRRFYLRPDEATRHIIAYCLARAARATGVKVHVVCAMSNHIHLVVTDVNGLLPQFSARLFREIALCIKAHRGVRERVWAAGSYSAVELVTERAVMG